MANVNIQSMIPLAGKGHTYRKNGGYTAGEYKQLVNAELNDLGYITSRRNINLCGKDSYGTGVVNAEQYDEFVGYIGEAAIVLGKNRQRAVYADPAKPDSIMFDPSGLDFTEPGYNLIRKVLRYNGYNIWITNYYNSSTGRVGVRVYRSQEAENSPENTSTIDLTQYTVFDNSSADLSYIHNYLIQTAFFHKERLWIVTKEGLYFSRPTDPTTFAVPDGGFFKFAESNINYALANKDSIYVVCDSVIYVISYSADPNLDAVVTKIDDSGGGDHATVFNGNVYYVKDNALNVINNNNVSKVMDLNLGFWGEEGNFTKVHAFGNYLVVQKHTMKRRYNEASVTSQYRINAIQRPWSLSEFTDNKPSCYFVNMTNGSIHALDFSDNQPSNNPGYVCDALLVPREDKNNNTYLYLLTKNSFNFGNAYAMPITGPDTMYDGSTGYIPAADHIRGFNDSVLRVNHHVRIEIDSFVPDGTEYTMKKFRSLMISAKFPYGRVTPSDDFLALNIAYDNREYLASIELQDAQNSINDLSRAPFIHRYPLNQRAHSISFLIELDPVYAGDTTVSQDLLIEDIRLFWTYTSRLPTKRQQEAFYDTI